MTKEWLVACSDRGFRDPECQEVPIPKLGEVDVLIRLNTPALIFRDLVITKGIRHLNNLPIVPLSGDDGDVVEVETKVSQLKGGNNVAIAFLQRSLYGRMNPDAWPSEIGSVRNGTLRQCGVFPETGLIRSLRNLTDIRKASSSRAALTAWNYTSLWSQASEAGRGGSYPRVRRREHIHSPTGFLRSRIAEKPKSDKRNQFAKAASATALATTSSQETRSKPKS